LNTEQPSLEQGRKRVTVAPSTFMPPAEEKKGKPSHGKSTSQSNADGRKTGKKKEPISPSPPPKGKKERCSLPPGKEILVTTQHAQVPGRKAAPWKLFLWRKGGKKGRGKKSPFNTALGRRKKGVFF